MLREPQAATKEPWLTRSKRDARTRASGSGQRLPACCWPWLSGLGWYLRSPQFADLVRRKLVATLEDATGGRVELAAFHWKLSQLAFEADNLTIHGLEGPEQLPYAHIDRALVRLHIISFIERQISLEQVELQHPVIHIIVHPDGTTNAPEPKVKSSTIAGAAVVRSCRSRAPIFAMACCC